MLALVLADMDEIHWHGATGQADLVLSLGDIDDCLLTEAAQAYRCSKALAVRGNHDANRPFPEGVNNLHLRQFALSGLRFGGFQGSWKYKPRGHYLYEQAEVKAALKDFPPVDIFLAHNSPRHIHDKEDEVHFGFEAFNDYILRARPKLFLHGHQHQNIETRMGETVVLGVYGSRLIELR